MSEIYQSTKALSVYNALSFSGCDMSRAEVEALLRRVLDANLDEGYVSHGAEYLVQHDLAQDVGGLLVIERLPSGRGRPVLRCENDRELMRGDL